jgi:hypothetical protein
VSVFRVGGRRNWGGGFSFLTAWWMKLFLRLVEWARKLRYLLQEGRRLNRLWLAHNRGRFSGKAGQRWASMILPAVLTMRCSAFLLYSVQLPPPHTVAGQDAFDGAPVDSAHYGWRSFRLLQFAKE